MMNHIDGPYERGKKELTCFRLALPVLVFAASLLGFGFAAVLPNLYSAIFVETDLSNRYLGQLIIVLQFGMLIAIVFYTIGHWTATRRSFSKLQAAISGCSKDQQRELIELTSAEINNQPLPIVYVTWVLPVSGFIGTVFGVSAAIAPLGSLISSSGGINEQAITDVLSGLNLAFDTTLFGLLLVLPAMVLSLLFECETNRRVASLCALQN